MNEQIRITGRRILLLVDNISSHRMDESLSNVKLQMLPPNTTVFLQPQDAGITSSFKAQIAKIQHRHIVDHFDNLLERLPAIPERCSLFLQKKSVITKNSFAASP
uniref:AlNc14C70G4821 protein n=1 Tax=Albugo laibachii Nc14 TaxID=890382 RepID=F0WDV2_9STRA|nr:AlNc14C70G4821 [Albugo laibachii Nc14]|eukprot:CCA19380.1 AlNc14C70G4821 [Albugo laibachii Nc14]